MSVSILFVQGLKKDLDDVFVPILEGETSIRDSSVMPSYIFVHMRMSKVFLSPTHPFLPYVAPHFSHISPLNSVLKEMMSYVSELNYVVNFVGADRGGRSRSGQMEVRERKEREERES